MRLISDWVAVLWLRGELVHVLRRAPTVILEWEFELLKYEVSDSRVYKFTFGGKSELRVTTFGGKFGVHARV